MNSFGKKLREAREASGLSQKELAKTLNTVHTVVGRYERDEMKPTIDVVKKLALALNTTVGYLLGETEESNIFKDPDMIRRFKEISSLENKEKEHILFALDAMLRDTITSRAYKYR